MATSHVEHTVDVLGAWLRFCREWGRRAQCLEQVRREQQREPQASTPCCGGVIRIDWLGGVLLREGNGALYPQSRELWANSTGGNRRLWVVYRRANTLIRRTDRVICGLQHVPDVLAWGVGHAQASLESVATRSVGARGAEYLWCRAWGLGGARRELEVLERVHQLAIPTCLSEQAWSEIQHRASE